MSNSANARASKVILLEIRFIIADPLRFRLITIYDCRVEVAWSATGANDTSARGTVVVPEVSHENTLDGVSDYTVRA